MFAKAEILFICMEATTVPLIEDVTGCLTISEYHHLQIQEPKLHLGSGCCAIVAQRYTTLGCVGVETFRIIQISFLKEFFV